MLIWYNGQDKPSCIDFGNAAVGNGLFMLWIGDGNTMLVKYGAEGLKQVGTNA